MTQFCDINLGECIIYRNVLFRFIF